MKLSIITINYNNAEGLRKTLASVAAQTYADIEHVIVDGGSTDGSVAIIEAYASDVARKASGSVPAGGEGSCVAVEGQDTTPANGAQPLATQDTTSPKATPPHKVTWISEPDKGIYNAMNKGIEIALGRRIVNALNRSELVEDKNKGLEVALGKRVVNDDHTSSPNSLIGSSPLASDYIQILNSGDMLYSPNVISDLVSQINERDEFVSILYGNMIKEYPNGIRSREKGFISVNTMDSFMFFYRGTLNPDGTLIHSSLFEKYGFFNENLRICSDWEWFVKAIALGEEKPVHVNVDSIIFDMMGVSESGGKNRDIIANERRAYLESILPKSVLYDYDKYYFPITQYQRLKKYHLWGLVSFVERVVFKLEKWCNKLFS